MKIIYCNHSIYNPGGMERVLMNKISWLVEHTDWEILVVTTDQKGKHPFYPVPQGVRTIDLGINYSDDNNLPTWGKITGYLRRRKQHRQRLTDLLMKEKADVVVSLFPSESSFLPEIKDGSKKVLELHFNKFFRLQYGRTGLYGLINRWRTRQDEKLVRRFDRFVVLTEEDKQYWGDTGNILKIPNAVKESIGLNGKGIKEKRVIAVGRLDYQKGFDRLIEAWDIIQEDEDIREWKLDIFGQGEWHDMLNSMIKEKGLQDTACINPPTKEIQSEYQRSSFLVMSSHYEGLPMVMVEAMAEGLPVVSFDFKCGPKDIIQNGINGFLVPEGDIRALAVAMKKMMGDDESRRSMSIEARKINELYSEERIMQQWVNLFEELRQ